VKLSAVEGRGGRRVVDESCWLPPLPPLLLLLLNDNDGHRCQVGVKILAHLPPKVAQLLCARRVYDLLYVL